MAGTKSEVQANYDRLSRWYDRIAGSGERQCREAGLRMLDVRVGERVLEVGFGTGESLLALESRVGEVGQVVGVDISLGMLKVAREKLRATGKLGLVELCQGDGAMLPFAPGRFDAIWMSFTLELFSGVEIPQVLAECRHALRMGGRLGLVSLNRPERPGSMVHLYEWAHTRFSQVLDCRPIPVRKVVEENGFITRGCLEIEIWGLPVTVMLGLKEELA